MATEQIIVAVILVVLWLAESWLPFFAEQHSSLSARIRHDLRNLLWAVLNSLLVMVIISAVFVAIEQWAAAKQIGLLRHFQLQDWQSTSLAVVLMDFWTYWWHRLNHKIPLLWRFHRMHHSDIAMNVSTAGRFHTGELLLSRLAWMVVVPALGVGLKQLVIYNLCLQPVVLLHHSNLRLPKWLDRGLTALLVSPAMHRVHHSRLRLETNSNYGSLFPWWDWIFGSFHWRRDTENIRYGVDHFEDPKWQSLPGMAFTPLEDSQPRDTRDAL